MKRWINLHSVRYKIVIYTAICVIAVGSMGNLFLFSYLNKIIIEKTNRIDQIYVDTIQEQIDGGFEMLFDMGLLCATNSDVAKSMRHTTVDTLEKRKQLEQAQKTINNYLTTFKYGSYINRVVIFNEHGVTVQGATDAYSSLADAENAAKKELADGKEIDNRFAFFRLSESITPYRDHCFTIILKVKDYYRIQTKAYCYIEVDASMVQDMFAPYAEQNHIFLTGDEQTIENTIGVSDQATVESLLDSYQKSDKQELMEIEVDGSRYQFYNRSISHTNISLMNYTNLSELELEAQNVRYTFVIVTLCSVLISIGSISIISRHITKPISRLISRIQRIAENDFSFDPRIEQSKDEIGEIGKVVNEMVLSVKNLLHETIQINEEKNKIEMAMLQAQVNPHFLYNTLDSIYWMSVLQRAPGISNMTRSLTNLLKNMAKGVSDKIPLREEISLLQDYINIQSIRYVETFEFANEIPEALYDYTIVKLTLQPIVENAIFHGIEPSERFGIIKLGGYEEEDFLYLTVEDNGAGMTKQEMYHVLNQDRSTSKNAMSGIGVFNVDRRIKLFYGTDCGLSVDSVIGEYTRITIKIRKECQHV